LGIGSEHVIRALKQGMSSGLGSILGFRPRVHGIGSRLGFRAWKQGMSSELGRRAWVEGIG